MMVHTEELLSDLDLQATYHAGGGPPLPSPSSAGLRAVAERGIEAFKASEYLRLTNMLASSAQIVEAINRLTAVAGEPDPKPMHPSSSR